jgi:hypothetical protein
MLKIKSVDYRNARYQGMLHAKSSKRDGVGIVMDDDLNFYCSEWRQGCMHGCSFLLSSDGSLLYGEWQEGQPSGLNVFRNQEHVLFANYNQGNPHKEAIAIRDNLSRITIFNAEHITAPDK